MIDGREWATKRNRNQLLADCYPFLTFIAGIPACASRPTTIASICPPEGIVFATMDDLRMICALNMRNGQRAIVAPIRATVEHQKALVGLMKVL